MNIWVTSDTHYWHKNIAGPKVSSWGGGYRDFENEEEMSKHIVKTFNQYIKEDDILYHLGDWSFGGIENIWNFRKQLRVKEIHLCLGNHDHHIVKNNQIKIPSSDRNLLYELNIPDDYTKQFEGFSHVNCRDLFTSVNDTISFKTANNDFFCSHYSHRVWYHMNKGIIHLYGHSHGNISDFGKSMDVGIDVAKRILGEYRPFRIEEIISIMDSKEIKSEDHHKIKI